MLSKGFGSATSSTDLAHRTSLSRASHVWSGAAWIVGLTMKKPVRSPKRAGDSLYTLHLLVQDKRQRCVTCSIARSDPAWQNVWVYIANIALHCFSASLRLNPGLFFGALLWVMQTLQLVSEMLCGFKDCQPV